jgi:pyruvate formate-lyase/glycerol dehydratase family glycyl radical enzyme
MKPELVTPEQVAKDRVGRLRQRLIDAPQEICVERVRYLTRAMQANWNKDPLARMSLALEAVLDNISVTIREDELIVGCRTSKLKGAPLFPENKVRWMTNDVENFDKRVVQRALISEAEKKELLDEVVPFWEGKTVEERYEANLPEEIADEVDKYVFTFMLEITYGIGHFTMNQPRVLAIGFSGIIDEAREKIAALSTEEAAGEKGKFYEAVICSLEAATRFARRYSDLALTLAAQTNDPVRKQELESIAAVCRRVPDQPAETFHEAIQSFYFVHLIAQIESGGNSVSLGRIDQILYPYFKKDLDEGRTDYTKARELIALLFLKTGEIWNVLEEAYIPGGEGTEGKTTQNVAVGGVDAKGADATNELSYIALDAFAAIRTVQPNFSVRFNKDTPEFFFMKVVEYAKDGVLLHFLNDETIIPGLIQGGHTIADARDYGVVGCLEPNAQGKSFGSTFAAQFNGTKCLEFALGNGVDNIFGFTSGVETGDPATFDTFDDVWQAYDQQINYFVRQLTGGMECLDKAIAEMVPSPFASAMIDGPLEKGLDLTKGGAIYNSTGVQLMGFSNIADGLYAVKKTVFEDKKFSLADLSQWLSDDWMDAEDKQTYMLNKIEKYGNDVDEVDEMARKVADHFCDVLAKYKNFRGGAYWPGIFSVGFHITMGAFTAATPDGRFAGDTLGNGITPSNGQAQAGPTAIMNSVTKLPLTRIFNGMNLNMRFHGAKTQSRHLVSLIKAYFEKGGFQVQFNMVDSDTLREAQQNPDKYRDLVVRISGYSGIFISLSDIAQDEIIRRTEYEM